jgi:hypothetical protein
MGDECDISLFESVFLRPGRIVKARQPLAFDTALDEDANTLGSVKSKDARDLMSNMVTIRQLWGNVRE